MAGATAGSRSPFRAYSNRPDMSRLPGTVWHARSKSKGSRSFRQTECSRLISVRTSAAPKHRAHAFIKRGTGQGRYTNRSSRTGVRFRAQGATPRSPAAGIRQSVGCGIERVLIDQ